MTCLVTLFDRKLQICKNSPKWTILDICYLLLSIQNVWDFLKIFTYNALHMIFFTNFLPIQWAGKLILFDLWFSLFAFLPDHCNSLFWAKSTKPKVPRVCHHRAVAKNKDVVPAKKSPIQPLPVEIMSWNQVLKTLLWIQIQPKIYPHKLFWKTDYIQHQKNCQNILICFENKIEKNNASSSVLSVIFQKVALNVFCISSLFLIYGVLILITKIWLNTWILTLKICRWI